MSYAAKLTKCEAEVARLTAELAAMRERCERLFELAQREHRECEDRVASCIATQTNGDQHMSAVLFPLDWEAQGRLVYIPLGGGRGQWQTAHNALHAEDIVTAHNAASAEWRRLYNELEDRRVDDCLNRMAQRGPSDDPYPNGPHIGCFVRSDDAPPAAGKGER